MIAVIADDFTGAAEIGGVGLRYGLKSVILTSADSADREHGAELLIFATNSRSLSGEEALKETERVTRLVVGMEPELIFKKIDSVLRGNITREITAHLPIGGKKRAIMVPANPGLGRTIEKGIYYVNGIPLNRTYFAQSHEFRVDSASVVDLVGNAGIPVVSRSIGEKLPDQGIIIADVSSEADLEKWARKMDEHTLAAGGAGFFDVILAERFGKPVMPDRQLVGLHGSALFILGSRYPKDEKMLATIKGDSLVRKNMPAEIYRDRHHDPSLLGRWAEEIILALGRGERVVVSADHKMHRERNLSKRIRATLGLLVKLVSDRVKLDNLIIEGGATTYEILNNLDIRKLSPQEELDFGIILMKAENHPGLNIITKPGSYPWPDHVEFSHTRASAR